MDCSSCGFENPQGMHFCGACGATLPLACAGCGVVNPVSFKFCGGCGAALLVSGVRDQGSETIGTEHRKPDARHLKPDPRAYTPKHLADKILTSRAALEGERKQVTVLFADVKGSMELAEQVDPEEWHTILDRFFQILTDGVHRFEGTVNQYTGDGIMALFGAPIAHEDHAQRACYAALHLRDALHSYADELRLQRGLNFSIRMGLNSGEVVVGKIGDDLRMDYTAQGHTVGLAARMEQLAASDRVYLTAHTAKLVSGYMTLRNLGPASIKGVTEPVHIYELEGAGQLRTRLDVSRARGFSRLVGRADDMAALELALKQAVDGRGQVVGIVGEPGVGKSRLCFEFTERCRARGVPVYDAHCPAHGKTLPFLPMLELLRSYFGITDADGDDAARKKIAGTLVLADAAFQEVLPLVFDFLGVPDPEHPAPRIDPEARQRQLFAFVRRLLQHRSRDAAILLLDDVHWIDPASDVFLAQLAEAVPGTHFLLALNFRPEYRAAWMGKSSYQQLPLYPLGPEASQELLADLLGISAAGGRAAGGVDVGGSAGALRHGSGQASPSPGHDDRALAELAACIGQRTGGNPFFIEEVVRALEEVGRLTGAKGAYRLAAPVDEITIPATVQAVLAARIDRLGEREKTVLQAAAVIGKEFSEPVLQRVISDVGAHGCAPSALTAALAALKKMEFVYEQALYPVAEYVFKHPLTQEVAYHSLLSARRARTHAAVARALETHERGEFGEQAAVIAYHWESAGDRVQAGRWHARAAKWAEASSSAEAARHWKRVRELLGDADAPDLVELALVACAALLSTGAATALEDAEAAAIFAHGMQLARRFPNAHAESRLVAAHGMYLVTRGAAHDALQSVEEAVQRAGESGDPNSHLGALVALAFTHLNLGRLLPALAASDQAVQLLAAAPQGIEPETAATALIMRGLLLTLAGQLQPAAESFYRAEQLIPAGNDVLAGSLTSNLAHFALQRGDAHAALSHAQRALDYAGRTSSQTIASYAHWVRGEAQNLLGDFAGALRSFEQALATGTMLNLEGSFVAGLAAAHLGLGDHDRARLTAEHAIEVARQRGHAISEYHAQLTLARVLAHVAGAPAAAAIEAALQEGERLIASTGARLYSPRLHEARARLAGVRGDAAGRAGELREALRLYTEMGATGHAERIESWLR